jgi:hypothetical protein
MLFKCLGAGDLAGAGFIEPFRGTAVSFNLRHICSVFDKLKSKGLQDV